ncbi:MAG TPA: lysyl oxidase family protein [Candidatus Dormibacteraeota bacterium]|nr:lysyl oxidase family protein [Candidatus Dormibacteraeota bacterium]
MKRTGAGRVILGAAWAVALPCVALAASDGRALQVSCSVTNTGGRMAIVARVDNASGATLQNVAAEQLVATSIGSASLLVQVAPRAVRELLAGRRAELQWSGRVYGDGYLNVAVKVSARAADGRAVSSGLVGCPRLAVGDPRVVGGMTPGSTRPCRDCHNGPPDPVTGSWTPARAQTAAATRATRTPTPTRPRVGTPTYTRTPRPPTPTYTRTRIPTATLRPTRTPRGGGDAGALPDLSVDQEALRSSVLIENKVFRGDECAIAEGCVGGTGRRRLLRFTTITPNLGRGDLVLGDPSRNSNYEWDQCHEHYDFEGFWDFRLMTFAGATVARGEKHAWCLADVFPLAPESRPRARFEDCGNQGVSAGWADVYARSMDCQWVDITGVPSGRYVLDVEVNPERRVREADYGNNTVQTEVYIPPESRR